MLFDRSVLVSADVHRNFYNAGAGNRGRPHQSSYSRAYEAAS